DDDMVAVLERTPFDAAPVDVDAVERAVVEDARAVGLMDDQGVAARDGRVIEPHVSGQRAADPRPLALYRHALLPATVLEGQVLAGCVQVFTCLGNPGRH